MRGRVFLHVGFFLIGGLSVAGLNAAEDSSAALLKQADAAYAGRENIDQAKAALNLYEKAIAADPALVEAHWKGARAAWWVGDHVAKRSEKLALFQKGIDLAKQGVALDSASVQSHFWLGGNYGSFGEAKGVLKSLFLLKPIRKEMEEVIRLDDKYLGGGGYRVLGVVDYKVPGFAGGNTKRSLERLQKALSIDPNEPFTHFHLAEYYKVTGNKAKAREHLQIIETLTVPEASLPELRMVQKKAEKLGGELR